MSQQQAQDLLTRVRAGDKSPTQREITEALMRGDRVELRGFGAFSVKNRPARVGRNPRTGQKVEVDEKYVPFFKTGKEMRERLNDGVDHGEDSDDED